jgi:hypothetical protein
MLGLLARWLGLWLGLGIWLGLGLGMGRLVGPVVVGSQLGLGIPGRVRLSLPDLSQLRRDLSSPVFGERSGQLPG